MIGIVGKIFEKHLAAHKTNALLNTMPLPLTIELAERGFDVYCYTGLPYDEVTKNIKNKMSDKRVALFTSEYEEGYELDDFQIDSLSDIVDGDTLVLFSNISDYNIIGIADYAVEHCDCKCVLYINQLFLSKATLRVSHHFFIEELYVQGYVGDIPEDKITVVPKGLSGTEIAHLMLSVIVDFEDALNSKH